MFDRCRHQLRLSRPNTSLVCSSAPPFIFSFFHPFFSCLFFFPDCRRCIRLGRLRLRGVRAGREGRRLGRGKNFRTSGGMTKTVCGACFWFGRLLCRVAFLPTAVVSCSVSPFRACCSRWNSRRMSFTSSPSVCPRKSYPVVERGVSPRRLRESLPELTIPRARLAS